MLSVDYIIREHPFFRGLPKEQLDLLVACARLKHFKRGEYILRVGDAAEWFYLVGRGAISLEIEIPDQGYAPLQTIRGGEVLGWSWLFPPYHWHFDARAVEPTDVISVDSKKLRALMSLDHELGYELTQRVAVLLQERLQASLRQIVDLYSVAETQEWSKAPMVIST